MSYDEDYFERGLKTGRSAYENYRWMPEHTIPFAHEIVSFLEIKKHHAILDFGCAKGYLVKALRLLNYRAWGTDISDYALNAAPWEIKDYLMDWKEYSQIKLQDNIKYDWIIAKDVLEHISYKDLVLTLAILGMLGDRMFVIVPLGNDGKYNAPTNDLDPTHVICEDFQWWCDLFVETGFKVEDVQNEIPYMKEAYKYIPNAHGFFKLKAR